LLSRGFLEPPAVNKFLKKFVASVVFFTYSIELFVPIDSLTLDVVSVNVVDIFDKETLIYFSKYLDSSSTVIYYFWTFFTIGAEITSS
jgi:hypothetical protein